MCYLRCSLKQSKDTFTFVETPLIPAIFSKWNPYVRIGKYQLHLQNFNHTEKACMPLILKLSSKNNTVNDTIIIQSIIILTSI